MKLLSFTIIKFTLCLIVGIVIAALTSITYTTIFSIVILLCFILGITWSLYKNSTRNTDLFGLLSLITFIAIGIFIYTVKDPTLKASHYSNYLESNVKTHKLMLRIDERLKSNAYNMKYYADVIQFEDKKTIGKILLNINIDSTLNSFNIDQVLFTEATISEIKKPLNPHQFDYAQYLRNKYVFHQTYLNKNEIIVLPYKTKSITGIADNFRELINKKLIKNGITGETLSIINALILGQKHDIDETIYDNYVNAGVIHILAVSGLHVGILLIILNFLLKPLHYYKYGRFLKLALLIAFLWSFAIIAGLSPSVTRSVTMFSIITIAYFYRRSTNIYNTLSISAFIILLVKPNFLFEVGFQLSYLAVLAIVSIQPIIYKLWQPKLIVTDKLWQIFSVTLAAQFGVAPVSLYYFHQFPGLFFVSNLVIIPVLGILLGLGILVIALSLFNILPPLVSMIYSKMIETLNGFISWIANFESFLLKDVSFGLLQVVAAYMLITSLLYCYKTRTYRAVVASFICILLFQFSFAYYKYIYYPDEFIILNKSRHTILAEKKGHNLQIYSTLNDSESINDYAIKNFRIGAFVSNFNNAPLKSLYNNNSKLLLVIDSLGIYNVNSFKPDYILLSNSPKINIERLIDSLKPKLVIADASSFKSYVQRWKLTCKQKEIPFHYTNEKGAFSLN